MLATSTRIVMYIFIRFDYLHMSGDICQPPHKFSVTVAVLDDVGLGYDAVPAAVPALEMNHVLDLTTSARVLRRHYIQDLQIQHVHDIRAYCKGLLYRL